jgi:hypothetical protein
MKNYLSGKEQVRLEKDLHEIGLASDRAHRWLLKRIEEEVDQWYIAQCRNLWADFYLYFKLGDIKIAQDAPEGYDLALTQRISKEFTREQVRHELYDILRRVPCLPATL